MIGCGRRCLWGLGQIWEMRLVATLVGCPAFGHLERPEVVLVKQEEICENEVIRKLAGRRWT